MRLSPDDLEALHQAAVMAATKAGRLVASHADRAVAVQHKHSGDSLASQVVTEVDMLSEAEILKRLQPACEQYDLALLSEESTDDRKRLEKDYFWSIDPLDGTLSFIESTSGYAVSIALVSKEGMPLIGVVYDPVNAICYSAVQGQGAWCNGEAWTPDVDSSMQGKVLTFICDRSLAKRNEYPQIRQTMEALGDRLGASGIEEIKSEAGAVMNACRAMQNSPACYFKLPKKATGGGCLWDFAATAAIFNELGAVATDCYVHPLELNRADYLYMNHHGVLYATHQELARQLSETIVKIVY